MKKLITLLALVASSMAQAWTIDGLGEFKFEKLNNQVYVMHGPLQNPNAINRGFINNPAFIDGDNGLILVDPSGSKYIGENVLAEIEKISSKPIVAVINTHAHGDHWLGNHAIKDKYPNAKFYAHMNMIKEAQYGEGDRWIEVFNEMTGGKLKGTVPVVPSYSIGDQDTLQIAGQTLHVHSPFPSSHSGSDIMVEHKNSKTLFTGDNGFNKRVGRFDSASSMHNNIEILKFAKSLDVETFVPGHGQSGNAASTIDPYLHYLSTIKQEVAKGYEDDLSDFEIKPIVVEKLKDYEDWSGFEDSIGRHVNKMFIEVEDRDM